MFRKKEKSNEKRRKNQICTRIYFVLELREELWYLVFPFLASQVGSILDYRDFPRVVILFPRYILIELLIEKSNWEMIMCCCQLLNNFRKIEIDIAIQEGQCVRQKFLLSCCCLVLSFLYSLDCINALYAICLSYIKMYLIYWPLLYRDSLVSWALCSISIISILDFRMHKNDIYCVFSCIYCVFSNSFPCVVVYTLT